MWIYEKKLQYPIKIKNPNAALAKIIISQLGGPDGELAASTRYLSQRFSMPYREGAGILTDVGTEELAHVEMISAIPYWMQVEGKARRRWAFLLFPRSFSARLASSSVRTICSA